MVSDAAIKSVCPRSFFYIILLFPGVFFHVLIASDPTAGFGSNSNLRCILPLPIIPQSFSSLSSSVAEKQLLEVRGGCVYLGHKTGSGGLDGSRFPNLSFT